MNEQNGILRYDMQDIDRIPVRRPGANKGDYGHVLVIAGSKGMCGAAFFAALAAYRTGAGLVRIFTPEDNRNVLQTLIPEAITDTYDPSEASEGKEAWKNRIADLLEWADAVILGPGLGRNEYVRSLTENVLSTAYVPLIIDADGLNTIAEYPYLTNYYTENIIITPHVGEMARLTGKEIRDISADLYAAADGYRNTYGVTCVLKSDRSIIAANDGKTYETVSGSAALAKAGSGDILTGMIAGMLCLGFEQGEAASFASFLHGLAGREAAKRFSEHGILARDIADAIPSVMRR